MSSSFCNCCLEPTSIPSCDGNAAEQCNLVKICGVVNQSAVKSIDDPTVGKSVLYCYRLEVSNCTGFALCGAQLSLALRWKYETNTVFQTFIPELNDPILPGSGLFNSSNHDAGQQEDAGIYLIKTNIPGAQPMDTAAAWDGDTKTALFKEPFDLPPGRFAVTVCFEIAVTGLPENCPQPALFPAVADFVSRSTKNSGCPVTVTALVGCSPSGVAATTVPP